MANQKILIKSTTLLCVAFLIAFAASSKPVTCFNGPLSFLDRLPIPGWDLLDKFLLDFIPSILGEKSANQNGTAEEFAEFALRDRDDPLLPFMTLVSIMIIFILNQENNSCIYVCLSCKTKTKEAC